MDDKIVISAKEWRESQSRLIDVQEKVTKLLQEKEKELLTPSEVCKMLRIGRNTYQRYVDADVIEQTKIKGKAYVKRSVIDKLIDEGSL